VLGEREEGGAGAHELWKRSLKSTARNSSRLQGFRRSSRSIRGLPRNANGRAQDRAGGDDTQNRTDRIRKQGMNRRQFGGALGKHRGDSAGHPARAEHIRRGVMLLVPFPAGSATDIVAAQARRRPACGVQSTLIIENSRAPTASSTAGRPHAPSDGLPLFVTPTRRIRPANIYSSLPYDPLEDFARSRAS